MKPVLVLTTVGAGFDAAALAHELVELHLAACVNIIDRVSSVYRWQGRVEDDVEQLLVIKTVEEQVNALREVLFARHPYDVPEFVVMEIGAIEGPYRDWLIAAVSPS